MGLPAGTRALDIAAISERTTPALFLNQAERLGERAFLRFHRNGSWQALSWAQVRDQVLRVAAALVGAGVEAGSPVLLMSPNSAQWIICDLGIQAAGAITVPVYPNTTAAVAQTIARDCGATLAIAADEGMAGHLKPEPPLAIVVRMDTEVREWLEREPDPQALVTVSSRAAKLRPDDTCSIIYTSGTTGVPKGVVLRHRNFVDMARHGLDVMPLGEDDISLSFLPYSHCFERINGLYMYIAAGITIHVSRGIESLAEDIAQVRPTTMLSVPRLYEKMHTAVLTIAGQQPAWRRALFGWALRAGRRRVEHGSGGLTFRLADRLVLAKLRARLTGGRLRFFISGGAPLNSEVERFFWAIGVPILQGWGLTETSAAATANRLERHRFGTAGWPTPDIELRLAEDGEIMVRGDGVMKGYHGDPDATAEVLKDGWCRTGDIGQIDPDGCLRITDRKKDLIKTAGGKYVAPQPLEARLQEDPCIERAVLIGDTKPYVVALVLPDWKLLGSRGILGDPEELVSDQRVLELVQARFDAVNRDLASFETVKYFRLLAHDLSEEGGELSFKLGLKRRVIQERFRDLIESMYREGRRPDGKPSD